MGDWPPDGGDSTGETGSACEEELVNFFFHGSYTVLVCLKDFLCRDSNKYHLLLTFHVNLII